MKPLIVYASRHGCTEEAVHRLSHYLSGEPRLVNLKHDPFPDVSNWDPVIVGGSIHAGKIQKAVTRFLDANRHLLLEKKLGLFLCCMEEGAKAAQEFSDVFPSDLVGHAAGRGLFGGRFDFGRMNWWERWITRRVANVRANVDHLRDEAIRDFATRLIG